MSQEASIQEVENGFIIRMYRRDTPNGLSITCNGSGERVMVCSSWLEAFTQLGIFFSAGLVSRKSEKATSDDGYDSQARCSIGRGF